DLTDARAYPGAIPRHVADALTSPVGHVYYAIRVQSQGHRVGKPHAGRGTASDVVAIVIGSSCNRLCKHGHSSFNTVICCVKRTGSASEPPSPCSPLLEVRELFKRPANEGLGV